MTQSPKSTESNDKAGHENDDGGNTQVKQDGEDAPRLPHETDQSADSQQTPDGTAGSTPRVGKQAHDDVERGLVDTDRGPVTDRVYNDKVKR